MRVFPDAKVLLTVRDAERWYESVKGSIYTANNYNQGTVGLFLKLVGQFRRMNIVLSTSNQGPPVNEKGKHVLIFLELGYYEMGVYKQSKSFTYIPFQKCIAYYI